MKRSMVDAILSMPEYNRFSKGIFSWVGFKTKWLEYENIERVAGVTKWNFKKLFVYALDGIIAFTLMPLYLIIKLGIAMMCLDFLALIVLLILDACGHFVFHLWVIILLIVAFFTSIILIALGISTMYQAKIYGEVKQRPIYIAKETNVK